MGTKRTHAPLPYGETLQRGDPLCEAKGEHPSIAWDAGDVVNCATCLSRVAASPQLSNVFRARGLVMAQRARKSDPKAREVDPRQTNFGDLFRGDQCDR
jgi:hypothetical protein